MQLSWLSEMAWLYLKYGVANGNVSSGVMANRRRRLAAVIKPPASVASSSQRGGGCRVWPNVANHWLKWRQLA